VFLISAILVGLIAEPTTIVFGGDIMLNAVPVQNRPLLDLKPIFQGANLSIANLEIPLTTSRTPTTRKSPEEIKRRHQFILKADPGHAAHLAGVGLDMVSLGNNHTMDYGPGGLKEMTELLRRKRIAYAGAGATRSAALEPAVVTTSRGKRVALISALAFVTDGAMYKCWPATATEPGIATLSYGGVIGDKAREHMRGLIATARAQADLVIVGVHWGTERQTVPNPYQVQLGRALVDEGADIVWGHHAHVLQGAEIYRGKPILYSMGNLISPLPGETGLVRLSYVVGQKTGFHFMPATISGGKVKLVGTKNEAAHTQRFRNLCALIQQKYPHKGSAAPTIP
jgi:poly-gamma-glutamate capsule biosynthesis protein CapA/YwtB (metallophosphatase superfamily)